MRPWVRTGFVPFHGWLYLVVLPFAAAMINSIGIALGLCQFIGGAEWIAAAGLILPGPTAICRGSLR